MNIPRFAFIESNTTGSGRLFARAAVGLGLKPMMVSAMPERYPYVEEDHLEVLRADTSDLHQLIAAIRERMAGQKVAGVMSSSDYFVAAAATVAAALGLAGPSPEAMCAVRDKFVQRTRLEAAGVPVPQYRYATAASRAASAAEAIGYPVVLKPCSGSGSYGVKLCVTGAEVEAHAKTLLAITANERGQPLPPGILVEELAVGPEYSIETFNTSVVGITAKHLGALPHFVEVGHDFPAELGKASYDALARTAVNALAALGLGWGPSHIEARITSSGPRIIEVNPRLAGGFIPELVRLALGIDLIALTVSAVAGKQPRIQKTANRHASIRFLLPPRPGKFMGISSGVAASQLPGGLQLSIYRKPGEQVRQHGDFRDRVGHVIAVGQTGSAARRAADAAHRHIKLLVEAENPYLKGMPLQDLPSKACRGAKHSKIHRQINQSS